MAEFNAGSIEADLTVNKDPFVTGLEEAIAWAKGITKDPLVEKLNIDTATALVQLDATLAVMRAEALAGVTVPIRTDGGGVVGGAGGGGGGGGGSGFLGSLLGSSIGSGIGAGIGGIGTGVGSIISGTLGGLGSLIGGGGRGGSMLGSLFGGGGGAGGVIPGGGAMASLIGLGPERILGSTLGVGGSLVGAGLGAGLLGLGAAGVAGVGMGTDLAGIGQAAGDIRQTTTAMTALNTAIATYGATSTQASTAQAQLNATVAAFPKVAQSAIVAAALQIEKFKQMFDAATGAAEKTGAQIINQTVQVAEKYIPTIGKYASENMLIIQKSLQPLFTWLGGPGLKIFQDLEKIFQEHLPAAMQIFVNGIELLFKTIDQAAQRTGPFIDKIAAFVTRMNTTDYGAWHHGVQTLIDDFFAWFKVAEDLAKIVYNLFKPSAGFGRDFANQLASVFGDILKWIKSSGIQEALHSLFGAHKDQFDILMRGVKSVLPVLLDFLGAWIRIEAIVTRVLNYALKPLIEGIAWLFHFKLVDQILGWAVAIGIAADAFLTFGDALLANPIGLVILALAALIVVAVEIAHHWRGLKTALEDVWKFMHSGWGQLVTWMLVIGAPFIGLPILIAEHWRGLETFFKRLWHDLQNWTEDFVQFWIHVGHDFAHGWDDVYQWGRDFVNFFKGVWASAKAIWDIAFAWIKGIPGDIKSVFIDAKNWLVNAGKDILNGLWSGIQFIWHSTINLYFVSLPNTFKGYFFDAIHWLENVGKDIVNGLWNGIWSLMKDAGNWVKVHIYDPIVGAVKGIFHMTSPSAVMVDLGKNMIDGFIKGMLTTNILDVIKNIFGNLPTALAYLLKSSIVSLDQIPADALRELAKVPGIGVILGPIAGGVEAANNLFNSILTGGISVAQGLAGKVTSSLTGFAKGVIGGIASLFGGGGGAAAAPAAAGSVQAMMQAAAATRGWTGAQWAALYNVERAEANFSTTAKNPSSSAYGLAQFIGGPGEYAQYGGNLSAAGQITAMLNYIAQRYGSPAGAWAHEQQYHWYDAGGILPPGVTMAVNTTGRNEYVSPGTGYSGPAIHIENVTFADKTDMRAFMNMADFYIAMRKVG